MLRQAVQVMIGKLDFLCYHVKCNPLNCANIHQGHRQFSYVSRRRQYPFVSFSAHLDARCFPYIRNYS